VVGGQIPEGEPFETVRYKGVGGGRPVCVAGCVRVVVLEKRKGGQGRMTVAIVANYIAVAMVANHIAVPTYLASPPIVSGPSKLLWYHTAMLRPAVRHGGLSSRWLSSSGDKSCASVGSYHGHNRKADGINHL